MSEMIERATQAMMDALADALGAPRQALGGLGESEQKVLIAGARAVIVAMHEPTEGILAVDTASISWTNDEIWKRMIDAALGPQPKA